MKRLYFFILFYYSSNALPDTQHNTNDLQKFFTSTNIRQQLNKQRIKRALSPVSNSSNPSVMNKVVTVNMQGLVIRQGHPPIVFLNNRNTSKSNIINHSIKINNFFHTQHDYRIPVVVNHKTILLKPGQQWSNTANKIIESYTIEANKYSPLITHISNKTN